MHQEIIGESRIVAEFRSIRIARGLPIKRKVRNFDKTNESESGNWLKCFESSHFVRIRTVRNVRMNFNLKTPELVVDVRESEMALRLKRQPRSKALCVCLSGLDDRRIDASANVRQREPIRRSAPIQFRRCLRASHPAVRAAIAPRA